MGPGWGMGWDGRIFKVRTMAWSDSGTGPPFHPGEARRPERRGCGERPGGRGQIQGCLELGVRAGAGERGRTASGLDGGVGDGSALHEWGGGFERRQVWGKMMGSL